MNDKGEEATESGASGSSSAPKDDNDDGFVVNTTKKRRSKHERQKQHQHNKTASAGGAGPTNNARRQPKDPTSKPSKPSSSASFFGSSSWSKPTQPQRTEAVNTVGTKVTDAEGNTGEVHGGNNSGNGHDDGARITDGKLDKTGEIFTEKLQEEMSRMVTLALDKESNNSNNNNNEHDPNTEDASITAAVATAAITMIMPVLATNALVDTILDTTMADEKAMENNNNNNSKRLSNGSMPLASIENGSNRNPTGAALASSSFLPGGHDDQQGDPLRRQVEGSNTNPDIEDDGAEEDVVTDVMWQNRMHASVAALLQSDYGEQDLDWKNKVVPIAATSEFALQEDGEEVESGVKEQQQQEDAKKKKKKDQQNTQAPITNRLGMKGKAPIHVEFVSFGARYGVPGGEVGSGNYTRPFPPFDCRTHIPDTIVPPHLQNSYDGLSGIIKHTLLRGYDQSKTQSTSRTGAPKHDDGENDDDDDDDDDVVGPNPVRALAESIAGQTATVIAGAMRSGYGYAMPLRSIIYVGSERGKHRSVVVVELAAANLRGLLRSNADDRFLYPCSVSTSHRELDHARRQHATTKKKSLSKQKQIDDD